MEGFVNSPDAVKGLEFYSHFTSVHCAGMSNAYMQEVSTPSVRTGRDADELLRVLSGPLQGSQRRRRQDRLLRQSEAEAPYPAGWTRISVVSYSEHRDDALAYIKWFAQPEVQKKWWGLAAILPQGGAQ